MFTPSAVVRELMAAGVTGDALVTALERLEQSSKPQRSAGAERQARYRERRNQEQTVTSNVTDVTSDVVSPLVPPLSPAPLSPPIIPPSSQKRGLRMPEGWEAAETTLAFGASLGLSQAKIDQELDALRDWAASAAGQNARKLDWDKAAKNWLRRAADNEARKQGRKLETFVPKPQPTQPLQIIREGTPEWEELKKTRPRLVARDIQTPNGIIRGEYGRAA